MNLIANGQTLHALPFITETSGIYSENIEEIREMTR